MEMILLLMNNAGREAAGVCPTALRPALEFVFHHIAEAALPLAPVATGFALLAADFAAPPGLGHRVSFRVSCR
jgi:hypothetical protein